MSWRRLLLFRQEKGEPELKSTDPAQRCLDLLKELREELEQTEQWNEVQAEIDALIREIEEELRSLQQGKRKSDRLQALLLMAVTTIRLILNLP